MRKNAFLALLLTLCLFSMLFRVVPTKTANSTNGTYDPWTDLNDDGKIDMKDVGTVARAFGEVGTPINKTALLYQVNDTFTTLLSQIDDLNFSLLELESEVSSLNVTDLTSIIDSARAIASPSIKNTGSQRVLEKAGFTKEGTIRNSARGAKRDSYLYSLLREEWKEPKILTRTT